MRDEDERHVALGHQVADEVEDLLLDGHIQRRGGFVGNQQVGPAGQRHGNGDALALPARELVGVGIKALRCLGNADAVQQRNRPLPRGGLVQVQVQPQGLCHLAANGVHGVEGRHGLLKHHADAVAAQPAHLRVAGTHQFLPVKADAAGDFCAFRQQAHERHGGERLAAARFANQAQGFAAFQRKAHAAHRIGRAAVGLQAHAQVGDFKQRHGCRFSSVAVLHACVYCA